MNGNADSRERQAKNRKCVPQVVESGQQVLHHRILYRAFLLLPTGRNLICLKLVTWAVIQAWVCWAWRKRKANLKVLK